MVKFSLRIPRQSQSVISSIGVLEVYKGVTQLFLRGEDPVQVWVTTIEMTPIHVGFDTATPRRLAMGNSGTSIQL